MVYQYRDGNVRPVGHESIDTSRGRQYIRVKVALPDKWEWKHRIAMTEKLGRPLRPGEKVGFRDGNSRNCAPENLYLREGDQELYKSKRKKRLEAAIRMLEFKKSELQKHIDGLNEQLKEME